MYSSFRLKLHRETLELNEKTFAQLENVQVLLVDFDFSCAVVELLIDILDEKQAWNLWANLWFVK